MPTIDELKEQETPPTPLFLFDCVLSFGRDGAVEHACGHLRRKCVRRAAAEAQSVRTAGVVERRAGWGAEDQRDAGECGFAFFADRAGDGFKGAQVTIQFLFYDLVAKSPASEARVVFRGMGNPPDEITESTFRLTFTNRLNLQRIVLPEVQIERQVPVDVSGERGSSGRRR